MELRVAQGNVNLCLLFLVLTHRRLATEGAVAAMKFWRVYLGWGKKAAVTLPLTFVHPPYLLILKNNNTAYIVSPAQIIEYLKTSNTRRDVLIEEMKSKTAMRAGNGRWSPSTKNHGMLWFKHFKFTQAQAKILENDMCNTCGLFFWRCFEKYDPCLCEHPTKEQ